MGRTIAWATLVAGALDILSAFVWSGAVIPVLQTVASGPFGGEIAKGPAGAPLGLLVHFAIMAVMVAVYVLAANRIPALNRYWWIVGPLYGVALWVVMYWIVMPLRWETFASPREAMPWRGTDPEGDTRWRPLQPTASFRSTSSAASR